MHNTGSAHPVTPPPRRVLKARDAAAYIGLSVRYLNLLVAQGKGPRKTRLSPARVGWTVEDLDAWVAERQRATRREEAREWLKDEVLA